MKIVPESDATTLRSTPGCQDVGAASCLMTAIANERAHFDVLRPALYISQGFCFQLKASPIGNGAAWAQPDGAKPLKCVPCSVTTSACSPCKGVPHE